jgi:hypothetical protein
MPDRRTRQGKRDLALLQLLGSAVPLDEDALEGIVAWVKSRPTAASEHLLLSLPRSGPPRPLNAGDIARIVARHATAADLPDDRRSPHVGRKRMAQLAQVRWHRVPRSTVGLVVLEPEVPGGQAEQQSATVGVRAVADGGVGRVVPERGGRVELGEPALDGRGA